MMLGMDMMGGGRRLPRNGLLIYLARPNSDEYLIGEDTEIGEDTYIWGYVLPDDADIRAATGWVNGTTNVFYTSTGVPIVALATEIAAAILPANVVFSLIDATTQTGKLAIYTATTTEATLARARSVLRDESINRLFYEVDGIWYDHQDLTTMYQDAAGTLPVYRPGTGLVDPPVGLVLDKSGGGYHASQATTTARPTLSGRYNLLTATETLSTQSVTTVATNYTLSFSGTGTVTLSGTATGTYSAGTHTITCTAGTLTLTVAGMVTRADLRKGSQEQLPSYVEVIPAPTHFVSKSGSDLNDGLTEETAWLTLKYAISAAPSMSVIKIGTGIYDEEYSTAYGFFITKTLSFIGDEGVILRSSGTTYVLYSQGSISVSFYNISIEASSLQTMFYMNSSLNYFFYKCSLTVGNWMLRIRSSCDTIRVILCDIKIPVLTSGIQYHMPGLSASVEVCGCNITIGTVGLAKAFISNTPTDTFQKVHFNDNLVSVQEALGSVSSFVYVHNTIDTTVSGNVLTSPSVGSIALVMVNSGLTGNYSATISKNTCYVHGLSGYLILVGSDGAPVNKNTIAATIEDNKLYGPMHYDPEATNSVHAILCGYISDAIVQRNTAIGFGYGIVIKGDGTSDHSGGQVFGNLFVNNTVGIYNKGPNGTKIYNNTLVNNRIYVNTNDGANNPTGLEIINNAYLMDIDTPFVEYLAPIADLVSDYNFGSSLRFHSGTLGNKTLTQWQTDVSLDANSIITTPLFDNEYRIAYPSDLWDSGTPITLSEPESVDMFGYLVDPSNPNIGCLVGQEELLTPTLPVYQGIVDANTYDTAGFPLYLKRDLVDDKHTLVTPTGGITGTRLQTTINTVTTTSETLAEGAVDLFANPAAGPQEITQWIQFGWVLSAYELAITKRFAKSKARLV